MKVTTGVFTSVEVDMDEWETDNARFFKITYPRGISDHNARDIKHHMANHYAAFPKNPDAMRPRVFVAGK